MKKETMWVDPFGFPGGYTEPEKPKKIFIGKDISVGEIIKKTGVGYYDSIKKRDSRS